jgi:hypothetical protein
MVKSFATMMRFGVLVNSNIVDPNSLGVPNRACPLCPTAEEAHKRTAGARSLLHSRHDEGYNHVGT